MKTPQQHKRDRWLAWILIGIFAALATWAIADSRAGAQEPGEQLSTIEVQYILKSVGYVVDVDGILGPQTIRAVKHFQKSNGLKPDGIVGPKTTQVLLQAASASSGAVRLNPPAPVPPVELGLWLQPFAPPGLDECQEMNFYRVQWGLPERFGDQPRTGPLIQQGIGWREARCVNSAFNYCCGGYWGNFVSSHLRSPGYRDGVRACGVSRLADIVGTEPIKKQKSACVTAVLWNYHHDFGPWDNHL